MDELAIRNLIADHLGVSPALAVDDRALADLGADALDVWALVLALEKAYGVSIPDDSAERCRTVGDVLDAVRRAPRRRVAAPSGIGRQHCR